MEKDTPSAAVGTTRASSTATPDVAGNAGYAMFANAFYLASRLLLPACAARCFLVPLLYRRTDR